jgi:hypothetical protein
MTALEDLEQGDVTTFTLVTDPDGSVILGDADDCTVLVESKAQERPETPASVTARVETVIRADGAVDYLVLDVRAKDDRDVQNTARDSSTTEAQPGSLDSIAEELVGEVQVRRRERDDRSTVVTDAAGERDRADATRSSEREREIQTDARDST